MFVCDCRLLLSCDISGLVTMLSWRIRVAGHPFDATRVSIARRMKYCSTSANSTAYPLKAAGGAYGAAPQWGVTVCSGLWRRPKVATLTLMTAHLQVSKTHPNSELRPLCRRTIKSKYLPEVVRAYSFIPTHLTDVRLGCVYRSSTKEAPLLHCIRDQQPGLVVLSYSFYHQD
jgi:hypothetical protein